MFGKNFFFKHLYIKKKRDSGKFIKMKEHFYSVLNIHLVITNGLSWEVLRIIVACTLFIKKSHIASC